jgi:NNP family nitrate/nitrite transporter-like MFS transporter
MSDRAKGVSVLAMNTLAFTVCFAVWMMNGVLVTFLVDNRIYAFDKAQIGWLLGIPVLTGSILRLPVGMWTDRFGGRVVFPAVLCVAAAGAWAMSLADSYGSFLAASLLFGVAGTGFAVGIAYTSVWFPRERQGTALGIFGVGNAGAALTSLGAPWILGRLTHGGAHPEGWRHLPQIYAALLVGMAIVFALVATNRRPEHAYRSVRQQLAPLASIRVWRFGLYYFLVFGAFVALSQWLIPYYVNVYATSVVVAGLLASIFSLPSGVIRALGGWLSDRFGARTTMYWVLGSCVVGFLLLVVPRMDITSPGEGVMATRPGTVTAVSADEIVVGDVHYALAARGPATHTDDGELVWPRSEFWQAPAVAVGDAVVKRQLLARGTTHIFFQANLWVFTALVFFVGIAMGVGKAAVYKHIPEYFPTDVGVVGGVVGVIGGLGGFFCPIVFGYLLRGTGIWTTTWMLLFLLSVVSFAWMHVTVRRMTRERAPDVAERIDSEHRPPAAAAPAVLPGALGTEGAPS